MAIISWHMNTRRLVCESGICYFERKEDAINYAIHEGVLLS